MEQIVSKVLTQLSKAEKYRYEKRTPTVLEEMIETMVEEEVKSALRSWLDENKVSFSTKLREYISKRPQFATAMAEQVLLGVVNASRWDFKVVLAPKER